MAKKSKQLRAALEKVEATKFTEVGYVGKDVDSIIRDLVEVAVKDAREYERAQNRDKAKLAAENRILDVLLPPARDTFGESVSESDAEDKTNSTRERFREMLRKGKLDDKTYIEFIDLIKKIDLEKSGIIEPKREPNTIILSEGSQLSIILYMKKQRKPMIYIYPAGHWEKLMTFVYKIGKSESLTKTTEKLEIESFN